MENLYVHTLSTWYLKYFENLESESVETISMIRDIPISLNKDDFRLEKKREHEITSTEFPFYILIVLVKYI